VGAIRDLVCKRHGPAPAALACRHLADGVAVGLHRGPGDGPRPDAWCDRCDEKLAQGGEWTIELARQGDMAMTCAYCYDLAIDRNRELPAHVRGARATLTVDEHRRLFDHATAQLATIQEAARAKWRFDTYARWDFDRDARTLAFTDPEQPTLIAGVRVVGTFTTAPAAFHWAWAEHDDGDLLAEGIGCVRVFGDVRGIAALTSRDWSCRLVDAWELSAVAGYLLGCDGIYRAQFDDRFWFMLLAGWRHPRRGSTESGFGPDA
jgi:hypothetical protein